jgi:hypothetical protein
MSRHTNSYGTVAALFVGLVLLVVVLAAVALVRLLPLLILGAVVVLVIRHRRRRPIAPARVRPVIPGQAEDVSEAAWLRAENDQLRAALRDAEHARHAAWDAAASAPPRPQPDIGSTRDQLLGDRLGGVHDLYGRQP